MVVQVQLQPLGDKIERLSDETLYDEVVMAINYLFVSSLTVKCVRVERTTDSD